MKSSCCGCCATVGPNGLFLIFLTSFFFFFWNWIGNLIFNFISFQKHRAETFWRCENVLFFSPWYKITVYHIHYSIKKFWYNTITKPCRFIFVSGNPFVNLDQWGFTCDCEIVIDHQSWNWFAVCQTTAAVHKWDHNSLWIIKTRTINHSYKSLQLQVILFYRQIKSYYKWMLTTYTTFLERS